MRIRILEDTAGEFRHYQQGEILDLTDNQALDLLRREVAEAVDLETASITPSSCEEVGKHRGQRPQRKRRKR